MMGAMVGWLMLKLGIGAGPARGIAFAALALVLVVTFGVGKCTYDRAVIAKHDAKRDAAIAKADRKADAAAAEQRRADDARASTETQQIKEAINEAKAQGRDPRAAYYECVRVQQAARARGRPPADC